MEDELAEPPRGGVVPQPKLARENYRVSRTDEEGAFRLPNLALEDEYTLIMTGFRSALVREILYNEQPIAGRTLKLQPGAFQHSLRVVLSTDSGTIAGRVLQDDEPVSRAYVVAVRQPAATPISPDSTGFSDENGNFQLRALTGEYRLLAFPAGEGYDARPPGTLSRLLRSAPEVEVTTNGRATVELEQVEIQWSVTPAGIY